MKNITKIITDSSKIIGGLGGAISLINWYDSLKNKEDMLKIKNELSNVNLMLSEALSEIKNNNNLEDEKANLSQRILELQEEMGNLNLNF